MSEELKNAIDAYWARELSELELKEYVFSWATSEGLKLFDGPKLKPTIVQRLGKKRIDLLGKMLNGLQIKF